MSQTIIPELPASMRDTMRKTVNRGLMVQFINADLTGRASLDVRSSIVLYDDAGVFEAAFDPHVWQQATEQALHRIVAEYGISYWSKGI